MAHETVTDAAKALGCTPRTVYNYTASDGFGDKLEHAKRERVKLLASMLDNATAQALACLHGIVSANASGLMPEVTVREQIEAARLILDFERRRSSLLSASQGVPEGDVSEP